MMSGIKVATNIGKAVGAIGYGINQTLNLSGKVYRASKRAIIGEPKYNVTIFDENGTVQKEHNNVSLMKVSELLTSIAHIDNDFGMTIKVVKGESNDS